MQDPINFFNLEYLFQLIYSLITNGVDVEIAIPYFAVFKIVSYVLTLLFIVGAIYSFVRLRQIREKESAILKILTENALSRKAEPEHDRWTKIVDHLGSTNENDWKLAIIEADTLLEDMMQKMGYTQDTLGGKLKSVEKSDFTTIEKAWEAHKVRNAIAHQGSGFLLSRQEANRVINLYKEVFQEFEYI